MSSKAPANFQRRHMVGATWLGAVERQWTWQMYKVYSVGGILELWGTKVWADLRKAGRGSCPHAGWHAFLQSWTGMVSWHWLLFSWKLNSYNPSWTHTLGPGAKLRNKTRKFLYQEENAEAQPVRGAGFRAIGFFCFTDSPSPKDKPLYRADGLKYRRALSLCAQGRTCW